MQTGVFVLTLTVFLFAVAGDDSMIAFEEVYVVPDVIDYVPKEMLQLQYGGTKIVTGMVMTPTNVKDKPTVSFSADPDAYYTLIMNDLDAPSRKDPKFREWLYWLVVNIPGGDISKGEEKTQYISPAPGKGTGLHRYVFLMFKQPKGKYSFSDIHTIDNKTQIGRANHNVLNFIKKYGMDSKDCLIAGNFFQAEYDEYVTTLILHLTL